MSGMYNHQWSGRQQQHPPPRKRRLVTYYLQPLNEQAGYEGQRQDGHRFGVNRILPFGDDGLISAGRDGVIRLWNVSPALARAHPQQTAAGEEPEAIASEARCSVIFASHTDWVTGLAVAAGRIMASSSNDGTIKLWDLAATAGTATRDTDSVTVTRRTPGRAGRSIGVEEEMEGESGEDEGGGSVGGRGRSSAKESCSIGTENGGTATKRIRKAGVDAQRRVVPQSGSVASAAAASRAPPRPSPLATVLGHGDYVKCLTYAPEAGVLVSGGLDKRIVLWDLQRMAAPLMVLRSEVAENDVDSSTPAGAVAAVMPSATTSRTRGGGHSESLRLSENGREGSAWQYLRDPSRVVLRPGLAATGPNEVLELCRQNKGSVYCVDASVDASLVASGGTDRMIRLLDPRTGPGRAAKVCKLDGHRDNVRCVRIDEGGTRVVSGSTDGTIRVWDVRQQCCLGVYELPGGSVWAMQPSPCDFDIYYSGGRGRRIYRTDFRTGESTLICMTNAEVLDMVIELGRRGTAETDSKSMSMWLSSTEPDIALWGGSGGEGEALRTGLSVTASATTRAPLHDVSTASQRGERIAPDGEGSLLNGPVEILWGQPGIVRHAILNNRRHVLTEDDANPPNVALWDVTKAKQIEVFPPGTVMEEKERALTEIIAVRPWFTVDTHLGTPHVILSENTAFDGELYAVDASGERQTLLHNPVPKPSPLQPQQQLSAVLGASSIRQEGGVGGAGRQGDGPIRPAKSRSVQDEVKVNLGEAVLRGLFSRWIEQPFRDGAGLGHSRRGLRGHSGTYSSDESGDEEDSDDQEHNSTCSSQSEAARSRSSSEGSAGERGSRGREDSGEGDGRSARSAGSGSLAGKQGLDLDLGAGAGAGLGGGRGIGDDTMLWVTETDLGGHGGIQQTLLQKRVEEFDGREGEDMIPHWVFACVVNGDFRVKEQAKVAFFLAPWVPPHAHVSSAKGGADGTRTPQHTSHGRRAGTADGVGTSAGGRTYQASQRFTAPMQMLVSKVMAYVLTHDELRQHLGSTGSERSDKHEPSSGVPLTPTLAPEEIVEVLCGDRILEPHLYVGAVQQYIWNPNASGTLCLHYRSRWR